MTRIPRRDPNLAILDLVVFLAGFAFLIHEVVWNRLLSLVLGATVTAATLVLAAFMAGFGIGAAVWGRVADRARRPWALLACLLLGLGVLGALAYAVAGALLPRLGSVAAHVGAALLLGVPSFLMGGLFPLAGRLAAAGRGPLASALGRLYALETLGSALGGLAAGFVLLGVLGQDLTLALAVAVDLALGAWLLVTRGSVELPVSAGAPSPAPAFAALPDAARVAVPVAAFACGFAILALQVVWMRMFRIYLTNTSYTFALIASLAILGLYLGSALFRRRADRLTAPGRSLLRALLLLAATALLGLLLLARLPEALMFPLQGASGNAVVRILLLPLVASLLIVVPPAVCSGYAFPLACSLAASGRGAGRDVGVGRDVGMVLAVNTAGCVLGPVVAAFVLIPALGAAVAIVAIIAVPVAAAWFVARRSGAPARTGRALLVALALLLAVAAWRPQVRILPPSFGRFDREVLFYDETVEGTVTVGRDRDTRSQALYTYVNNSAVIGSSYDAVKVVKMVGHFPFLVRPDLRDVLVIGFGIGVTTSAIASHPEVRSITCVELVPGLAEAATYYRDLNRDVASDPRLTIVRGDGRRRLQASARKYDLISCDPTHPVLGSGNLYTREYFELCRSRLNPGGLVSQYLPLHKLRTAELMGLIATFHDVFPDGAVWLGHYHAVLLGSTAPLRLDFGEWAARAAALGEDPHFYNDPYHLAATLALDGPTIGRLTAGARLNTDDRSYTEFFAPGCLDEANLSANLRYLQERRVGVGAVFDGIPDPALMARFVEGNRLLTESLVRQTGGDPRGGLQALQEACRANPEDLEYPFLIRMAR
ncbi:MAG: fused MFS/spermidine synthase [bacterium]|nr:fused MFS/spermidine synthase [bacterium]